MLCDSQKNCLNLQGSAEACYILRTLEAKKRNTLAEINYQTKANVVIF
jgi:hypothetical protein